MAMFFSFMVFLVLQPAQASRLLLSDGAPSRTAERPIEASDRRAAMLGKSVLFLRPGANQSFLQGTLEEHPSRASSLLHAKNATASGALVISLASVSTQGADATNWSLPGEKVVESALGNGNHGANETTWSLAGNVARDALLPEAVALLPAAQLARSALWTVADDVASDVEPAFASGRQDPAFSRRRFRARLGLLLVMAVATYFATLIFSASVKYRLSHNASPVAYYADQRFHDMSTEGHDLDSFLDAFNASPKKVVMQVTGFAPARSDGRHTVAWQGRQYRVAFDFSLDLSPWVTHVGDVEGACDGNVDGQGDGGAGPALWNGVAVDDLRKLRAFLEEEDVGNGNDLTVVQFEKDIAWPEWEELATNIKSRIRQSGFDGVVHIRKTEHEGVEIYKNRPWANFMHSHTAKVLCALSFVGSIVYYPYMWLCSKRIIVHSHYRVNVSINSYWPLIADKLGARGFCQDERSV